MTPEFLRHEAARFRGMAEGADREATKLRLLAMAADYEARAGVANEMIDPDPTEGNSELAEPAQEGVLIIKPVRKIATGLKETAVVQRRPVGRPRRE